MSIEPFERVCTERFRSFVEQFGHILAWERVGSAQDIWLQLAHGKSPGGEGTSTALCSFQLHGIRATDLDRHAYHRLRDVTVLVDVQHLRYWHFQPMPTYLVIYVESADEFLWLNIQHHIRQVWRQAIPHSKARAEAVGVPRDSVLDRRAFERILAENDLLERRRAIENKTASSLGWLHEVGDHEVIWRVGTADVRGAAHALHLYDLEDAEGYLGYYMFLEEALRDRAWESRTFRIPDYWVSMKDYPYLDTSGAVRLNELGEDLFAAVQALERFGLLAISSGTIEPGPSKNVLRFAGSAPTSTLIER